MSYPEYIERNKPLTYEQRMEIAKYLAEKYALPIEMLIKVEE